MHKPKGHSTAPMKAGIGRRYPKDDGPLGREVHVAGSSRAIAKMRASAQSSLSKSADAKKKSGS